MAGIAFANRDLFGARFMSPLDGPEATDHLVLPETDPVKAKLEPGVAKPPETDTPQIKTPYPPAVYLAAKQKSHIASGTFAV